MYLFFYSHTPIYMSFLLVGLTAVIAFLVAVSLSIWIGYSIFLVFLGGIIVIFLYARTLSFSVKLVWNFNFNILLGRVLTLFIVFMKSKYAYFYFRDFFCYFYIMPYFKVLLFLMVYLLVVLFLVVKIIESFKGALVKFW